MTTSQLWLVGADADFGGPGGDVLFSALRAAGLQADTVHRECYAPERIAEALHAGKPKVIVAFGNEVCARLIGDAWPSDGIEATRGYLWDTAYGRVLSAMSPGAVVAQWTPWRALLDFDLRRAKVELAAGAPPLATREVSVVTTPTELAKLHRAVRDCVLLSIDIENTHDLALACVGFAPTVERAWVIPAVEDWQLDSIRTLCESNVPKVLQNGQYDRMFLKRFNGIVVRRQVFDTMLSWHCLPGNALVDTLKGPTPIGELADKSFWVWSWKDGKPWPTKATAFKTRENAPLLRVRVLRRGKGGLKCKAYPSDQMAPATVICTPEHRFLTACGWVEAQHLQCGDSLSRICFNRQKKTGRLLLQFGRKAVIAAHYVLECLGQHIPKGKQVHHKDERPINDEPDNLEVVTRAEHNARHADILWTGEHRRGLSPANKDIMGGKRRTSEEAQQLYDAGLSVAEIANMWKAVPRSVRRLLTRVRSLKEAQRVRRQKQSNCRVLDVAPYEQTEDVYCLNVPETGCFSIEGGIIVHNSLNPELAGKKTDVGHKKAKARRTAKSLKFLSSIYTRDAWWKAYDFETEAERYMLCGRDVCVTLEIALKMIAQLDAT